MTSTYTLAQLDADIRALREKALQIEGIRRNRVANYFGKIIVEAGKVARLKDEPQDNKALQK